MNQAEFELTASRAQLSSNPTLNVINQRGLITKYFVNVINFFSKCDALEGIIFQRHSESGSCDRPIVFFYINVGMTQKA